MLPTGSNFIKIKKKNKLLLFLAGTRGRLIEEGCLFEEAHLFQISCSREALNRREALIRERAFI